MLRFPITFHDWTGSAVWHDRTWWLSPRQLADHLALNWSPQYRKIRGSGLHKGVLIMSTPSAGGSQDTILLSIDHFAVWLLSISASKVAPDRKALLVEMQEELIAALRRQLTEMVGLPTNADPEELLNAPMPDWARSSLQRAEVIEAREAFLLSAENLRAAQFYNMGLPGTKVALFAGRSAYWARKLRRTMLEPLGLVPPRKPPQEPAPLPLFEREGDHGDH